jgi:mono/diheme cytochrome c family protein
MQIGTRMILRTLAVSALIVVLGSCGNGSKTYRSTNQPLAVAHFIGLIPTSAAGADPAVATARSQSQVTLTGNASDGVDSAITGFTWSQTDSDPAVQVTLLYASADTITFTAPKVQVDNTPLHFLLTITTANGKTASAHATVMIKAVSDPNQFLALPAASPTPILHRFKVAVATQEGLGSLMGPSAPALTSDVPVCVTLSRTIVYTPRDPTAVGSVPLPDIPIDASWTASIGGAPGDFKSYSNPKVVFDIPDLNQDVLIAMFNNPVPGTDSAAAATRSANFSRQLVGADIDGAYLSLTAAVKAGSCDGTLATAELSAKTLQLEIQDQSGNKVGVDTVGTQGVSVVSPAFQPDDLVSQQSGQYETAATASAYYDAIDPSRSKTTLAAWLDANCFDSTKSDFGADTHAVYTNNFDLGFGRDMYAVSCKSGTPKAGDMATVVINYPSLEAAASKLNAVIAVAMEYGAATCTNSPIANCEGAIANRRFPKFYVFAPDDRDGSFHRVQSLSFDHRGEKYVPGACVMCHGGTLPTIPANFAHASQHAAAANPNLASTYPTVGDPTKTSQTIANLGFGDIDATFIPWDLDSLLYSEAPQQANQDLSYVGLSVNPSLYSRTAQEAALKRLNQFAYCTYQPEVEPVVSAPPTDRFAAPRALVGRWYGGTPGSDGTYGVDTSCATGAGPTASLLPNSAYNDADTAPLLWSNQSAPGQVATPTLTSQQLYHSVFARNCRSCHTQNATITDQFADYASFINMFQPKVTPASGSTPASTAPGFGVQYAFTQGRMPLARLTMDRFWVNYSGGDSAAKVLATHVQQVTGETDLLDAAGDAVPPGAPVANLNVSGPAISPLTLPYFGDGTSVLGRFGGVQGDASASFFISNFNWSLCVIPLSGGLCAPQDLAGGKSAEPGFLNSGSGEYDLTLLADNGLGGTQTRKFKFNVPHHGPILNSCPSTLSYLPGASNAPIDFSSCITGGDEPNNTPNAFEIQDSSGNWVTALSTSTWAASTTTSFDVTKSRPFQYHLTFAFSASATLPVTLVYRVRDFDGGAAGTVSASITFKITDKLVAGGGNVTFKPPGSPYTILASLLNNTVVPSSDTAATMVLPPDFSALPPSVAQPPAGAAQLPSSVLTPRSLLVRCNPLVPGQCAADVFTFTPPTDTNPVYLNCDVNFGDIDTGIFPCSGVSFWYYLLSGDGATTSPALGQFTIFVQAKTSFSRSTSSAVVNVFDQLSTTQSTGDSCASCHSGGGPGTTVWTLSDAASTYSGIAFLIAPGDASSSTFYLAPCNASFTPSGMTTYPANGPVCTAILNWINEGAHND